MFKKVISLLLVTALLLPFTSAAAAGKQPITRSIEEILTEYHMRASASEQKSTSSSRSVSTTPEDETIETLTNAGYEAYHVSSSNYDELERSLQTDLSAMGIYSDGSYILVMSDGDISNSTNSARIIDLPNYSYDSGIEGGRYYITYNGVRYFIKYATVTYNDNKSLGVTSTYNLSQKANVAGVVLDSLTVAASLAIDTATSTPISSIATLLYSIYENCLVNNCTYVDPTDYTMDASSSWVRQFILVWSDELGVWVTCQSSAYVVSWVRISTYFYNSSTGALEEVSSDAQYLTQYSALYYDTDQRELDAVAAFIAGLRSYDITGDVDFYLLENGTVVSINGAGKPLFTHKEQVIIYY